MNNFYLTPNNKIVTVEKGPKIDGGYTFYKKPDLRTRGKRIRGRGQRLWFNCEVEAVEALAEYAEGRNWKPITMNEALKIREAVIVRPDPVLEGLFSPRKER